MRQVMEFCFDAGSFVQLADVSDNWANMTFDPSQATPKRLI